MLKGISSKLKKRTNRKKLFVPLARVCVYASARHKNLLIQLDKLLCMQYSINCWSCKWQNIEHATLARQWRKHSVFMRSGRCRLSAAHAQNHERASTRGWKQRRMHWVLRPHRHTHFQAFKCKKSLAVSSSMNFFSPDRGNSDWAKGAKEHLKILR